MVLNIFDYDPLCEDKCYHTENIIPYRILFK